jgi:hypothetical protein
LPSVRYFAGADEARKPGGQNMKYKTTAKAVKAGYHKIISVGYCELQGLLSYKSPDAYASGYYGWNFDVYDIDGVAICTGYRGMPEKNSKASYKLIREYEAKAEGRTAEEKEALIKQFIKEV